ncbi:MAG: DNA polymerase III subunit gamma/tau [Bacilli bacterium]
MEYLALYRKYRPIRFSDISGQDNIVKIIHNSIVNNKISHAYLLCGPRGTGKTTMAKLIARMVNCENLIDGEPCGKCNSCLSINNNSNDDIIEMDAASNNGVDEIREIRDKVNLVPSISKYKVYIIDEVHMLSTGAFNALLKTLEEPPKHVIFILATTEEQKIPLTIASRCQKYNFTKLTVDNIVKRLKEIVMAEKLTVNDEVLTEIARFSDGGMRDAINMLDQLVSSVSGEITINNVYEINGILSFTDICDFLIMLSDGNLSNILNFVDKMESGGKDLVKLLEEMLLIIKDVLIFKNCPDLIVDNLKKPNIQKLGDLYNEEFIYYFVNSVDELIGKIKFSSHPTVLVQVFFVNLVNYYKNLNDRLGNKIISGKYFPEIIEEKNQTIEEKNYFPGNNDEKKSKTVENNKLSDDVKKIRINNALAMADKKFLLNLKKIWNSVGEYLLDKNFGVIAGLLNDTIPVVASEEVLILVSENNSVISRLNEFNADVSLFLKKFFNLEYKVAVINNVEWDNEKKKFVENKKNNIKYIVISEDSCDKNKVSLSDESKKSVNDDVNNLINIIGDDIIEYM